MSSLIYPVHLIPPQGALHVVSTDVISKALFPDWFLKYAPTKRLRNVHTAFDELEVRLYATYANMGA